MPVKAVSSAYFINVHSSLDSLLSDVYKENRNGDKTVPWGHPVFMNTVSDINSFISIQA